MTNLQEASRLDIRARWVEFFRGGMVCEVNTSDGVWNLRKIVKLVKNSEPSSAFAALGDRNVISVKLLETNKWPSASIA